MCTSLQGGDVVNEVYFKNSSRKFNGKKTKEKEPKGRKSVYIHTCMHAHIATFIIALDSPLVRLRTDAAVHAIRGITIFVMFLFGMSRKA